MEPSRTHRFVSSVMLGELLVDVDVAMAVEEHWVKRRGQADGERERGGRAVFGYG